jgi:hypothetical protein
MMRRDAGRITWMDSMVLGAMEQGKERVRTKLVGARFGV